MTSENLFLEHLKIEPNRSVRVLQSHPKILNTGFNLLFFFSRYSHLVISTFFSSPIYLVIIIITHFFFLNKVLYSSIIMGQL